MNSPIRRLTLLVAAMFALLLAFSSWVQFADSRSLRNAPGNSRTLLSAYEQERGAILVDQTQIARSEKTEGELAYIRTYPSGKRYGHLTGWFSFSYGAGGLELAENDLLSGQSDSLFYRRLGDLLTGKQPTGVNIELTIDPRVQQAAAQALGTRKGAIVALDPRTGAILAMTSSPQYDPNTISTHDAAAAQRAWTSLNDDPAKPMVNRAITGDLYPAGSTMKVVTAAAALSSGQYDEHSSLTGTANLSMPGTTVTLRNDWRAPCDNGTLDMTRALQISCNTAFGQLGMDLGAQALTDQAAKFGFAQPLTVPLPVTPSSLGPMPGKPQEAFTAIGQQDVRVTPLQMAMVAAGVANRGVVMRPYLVKQTRDSGLEILDQTRPVELSRAVSPDVAAALTRMMTTVTESGGTGVAAALPGVRVAGKSGTAEHGTDAQGRDLAPHAWFISFAPADDPKIAVAVVVEDGGLPAPAPGGSFNAAPLAQQVMKAVINP